MNLFSHLFASPQEEVIALFDIGATRVAGALVRGKRGTRGEIMYLCSTPIEPVEGETAEAALVRALVAVVRSVSEYGSAELERRGHVSMPVRAIASFEAPWQVTRAELVRVEGQEPVQITQSLLTRLMREACVPRAGRVYTEAVVAGAVLEGYAVARPLGHRANEAYLQILASDVAERTYELVEAALALYIDRALTTFISGTALRLEAMRALLPHEDGLVVLDAMGGAVQAAHLHRGTVVGMSDTHEELSTALRTLAAERSLATTLVVLARAGELDRQVAALDGLDCADLWRAGVRPRRLVLDPSHVRAQVGQSTLEAPDIALMLMAVYALHAAPQA